MKFEITLSEASELINQIKDGGVNLFGQKDPVLWAGTIV